MEKETCLRITGKAQNTAGSLFRFICLASLALFCTQAALAQTIRSVSSGDWNNPATWEQGIIPSAGAAVEIVNGHQVTITGNITTGSINVYPPHNSDKQNEKTELLVNSGASLQAASLFLHNKNDRRYSSLINQGGSITMAGFFTIGDGCIVTNQSGEITTGGTLTNAGTIDTGSGTLNIGDTYSGIGIFNKGTGTVVYSKSNASQTINNLPYHNLQLSGGTIKYPAAALSVSGNLTIADATTLQAGNYSHIITGDVENRGILSGQNSIITLGGNWLNYSVFNEGTSTINLAGNTLQTITGDNTFYNFNFTGTAQAELLSDITITNGISVTQSHLNTNTHTVWLSNSASLTTPETDAAHIIGTVQTSRTLIPATTENFGNIGLSLSRNDVDPGLVTVERLTGVTTQIIDGNESVTRQYNISRSGTNDITSLEMTMDMEFLPNELKSRPLNEYKLYNKGKDKEALPVPSSTVNQNTIRHTNSNRFGTYTLAPSITPMPVELISFKAIRHDMVVTLKWATASEENNMGFEVQSATDGLNFTTIDFVESLSPFSSTLQNYTYTDNSQARQQKVYYRLKQVDYDGKFSYSKVQAVAADATPFTFSVSPNPFAGQLRFALDAETMQATLSDLNGKVVLNQSITTQNKDANGYYTIDTNQVNTSGLYILRIQTPERTYQAKLLKN